MTDKINVFYIGQDDLIELLATSICSICYNTDSFIEFYILDCGICKFNKMQINKLKNRFNNFNITYLPIDLNRFSKLKKYKGFSDFWAKLLIPEIAENVNRAIYLDTDTILLNDIKLLWTQDLGEYAVGAVPATYYDKWRDDAFSSCYPKSEKWLFINTGMLLIDCEKWRKENIVSDLLKLCEKYNDVLDVAVGYDEAMVSLYFESNFKVLDCRFNMTDHKNTLVDFYPFYTDEYVDNEWKHCVVRHFAGSDKPWCYVRNDYDDSILKNYNAFWFFANMTPYIFGIYSRFKENLIQFWTTKNLEVHDNSNRWYKNKYKLFGFIPIMTVENNMKKKKYRFLGCIPLMVIKKYATKRKYLLLGFIPVMTISYYISKTKYRFLGFIPLMVVRKNGQKRKYKLFGFIKMLTKKEK